MNYSKEDMLSLIQHLGEYPLKTAWHTMGKYRKYVGIIDFFEEHYNTGAFDFEGLTNPPASIASANFSKELQELWPDVWYALNMPDSELPLWIGDETNLEYPIARWRLLRRGGQS